MLALTFWPFFALICSVGSFFLWVSDSNHAASELFTKLDVASMMSAAKSGFNKTVDAARAGVESTKTGLQTGKLLGHKPWTCPSCKEECLGAAYFCPMCGTTRPEPRLCPSCGTHIPEGTYFCQKCGTKYSKLSFCGHCGKQLQDDESCGCNRINADREETMTAQE